jgi:hypothetical protein
MASGRSNVNDIRASIQPARDIGEGQPVLSHNSIELL